MKTLHLLLKSMRPSSWYKNLVVFLGIVFGGRFLEFAVWERVVMGFIVFCALTGGMYILNDLIDRDKDRQHPAKSRRPIASSALNPTLALVVSLLLVMASLVSAYLLEGLFFLLTVAYLFLDLAYFVLLKRTYLADILTIASGFVIRAAAGAVLAKVVTSSWLVIGTFLLALLLALAKRRKELEVLGNNASKHRQALEQYSVVTVDRMVNIVATALLVSYLMYTTSLGRPHMMVTIPFGIYCIFRYLFLIEHRDVGDRAELILADRPMCGAAMAWVITVVGILVIWP